MNVYRACVYTRNFVDGHTFSGNNFSVQSNPDRAHIIPPLGGSRTSLCSFRIARADEFRVSIPYDLRHEIGRERLGMNTGALVRVALTVRRVISTIPASRGVLADVTFACVFSATPTGVAECRIRG